MNVTFSNCSDARLRELLESSDAIVAESDAALAAAEHVEHCSRCQARLAELAAEPAGMSLPRVPGRPVRSMMLVWLMRPPMATIRPSRARTTLSVSLTVEAASGSLNWPRVPRSISFSFSSTVLTAGWMCRTILSSSSICGVTSRAMPEK